MTPIDYYNLSAGVLADPPGSRPSAAADTILWDGWMTPSAVLAATTTWNGGDGDDYMYSGDGNHTI